MKKLLTGLIIAMLSAVLCFCLTACGSSATKVKFGEKAASSVAEMTVKQASYGIALGNSLPFGANVTGTTWLESDYLMPHEYNSQTDAQNPFVASTGKTYVSFQFEITCTDRNGNIRLNSGNSTPAFVESVTYNGKEYKPSKIEFGFSVDQNGNKESLGSGRTSSLVSSGEILTIRGCCQIDVEVKDLTETPTITFALPDELEKSGAISSSFKTKLFTFSS